MSTKAINFRIDEKLKTDAEKIFSEMGLTMSSALNLFLQQTVNKKALPFPVETIDAFYKRENLDLLYERLAKYEKGVFEEKDLID